MPTHPTRRRNRTRGRLAADTPAYMRENPNAGHRSAAPMSYATRTLANLESIARFEHLTRVAADGTAHRDVAVTFPARDRIGRRNPRRPRTPLPFGSQPRA